VQLKPLISITVRGQIPLGDAPVDITSHFVGEAGQDILVFERGLNGDAAQRQRVFFRLDPKPTPDQLRFDKSWRKERAKKIATELGIATP